MASISGNSSSNNFTHCEYEANLTVKANSFVGKAKDIKSIPENPLQPIVDKLIPPLIKQNGESHAEACYDLFEENNETETAAVKAPTWPKEMLQPPHGKLL